MGESTCHLLGSSFPQKDIQQVVNCYVKMFDSRIKITTKSKLTNQSNQRTNRNKDDGDEAS